MFFLSLETGFLRFRQNKKILNNNLDHFKPTFVLQTFFSDKVKFFTFNCKCGFKYLHFCNLKRPKRKKNNFLNILSIDFYNRKPVCKIDNDHLSP